MIAIRELEDKARNCPEDLGRYLEIVDVIVIEMELVCYARIFYIIKGHPFKFSAVTRLYNNSEFRQ